MPRVNQNDIIGKILRVNGRDRFGNIQCFASKIYFPAVTERVGTTVHEAMTQLERRSIDLGISPACRGRADFQVASVIPSLPQVIYNVRFQYVLAFERHSLVFSAQSGDDNYHIQRINVIASLSTRDKLTAELSSVLWFHLLSLRGSIRRLFSNAAMLS